LPHSFEGDIRHFKIRTSLTEDGWAQHQISNRVFDSLSSLIAFYQSHPLLCGKDKSVLLKRAATEQDIALFMDSLHRPYEEIQAIAGVLEQGSIFSNVGGAFSLTPARFPAAPEDRKATVSGDLLLARKRAASRAAAAAEHSHANVQPPPAEPAPTRQSSQGAVSAEKNEDAPALGTSCTLGDPDRTFPASENFFSGVQISVAQHLPSLCVDIAQRGGRIRKNVFYEWARLTIDGGSVCYEHLLTRERVAAEPTNFPGDVFVVQGEKTIRVPRAQAEATIRATHVRLDVQQVAPSSNLSPSIIFSRTLNSQLNFYQQQASKTRASSVASSSPVCSPRPSLRGPPMAASASPGRSPRLSQRGPPTAAAAAAPTPPERPPLRREVQTLARLPPADTAPVRRPSDPRVVAHAESREGGAQAIGGVPAVSRSAKPRAAISEEELQAEPVKAPAIDRSAREANTAKAPAGREGEEEDV
jgi:hypothetical protein